jgi:hypothetical protein
VRGRIDVDGDGEEHWQRREAEVEKGAEVHWGNGGWGECGRQNGWVRGVV